MAGDTDGAAAPGACDCGTSRSRWLTVNDAMDYLDAVKLEFRHQPEVYDEFLAIMGRFKTKQMLPPDVIGEVARLFRGRNSLVLRFNRFLPDGYKIGPSDIQRMEDEYAANEAASNVALPGGAASGQGGDGDRSVMSVHSGEESDIEDRAMEFDHAIYYVTTIKKRFSEDVGTYKAFLEILHTYQREQQDTHSGINHVLEQITDLFADEPDLLREFTYFLPDTVQAQAKERLDRAAVEAEVRLGRTQNGQRGQRLPPHRSQGGPQRGRLDARARLANSLRGQSRSHRMQQRGGPGESNSNYRHDNDADQEWREQRAYGRGRINTQRGLGSRSQYSNGGMGDPDRNPCGSSNPQTQRMGRQARKGRHVYSHAEDYELGSDGVFKGPKKRIRESDDAGGAGQGRGWSSADSQGTTIKTSPANQLFDQARDVLSSSGDDTDWTEFLKCLDLFSNEILGRDELLDMVHDLFEAHDGFDLMDEFKDLVYRRGKLDPPPRDAMPTLGLSEINFQSAKMCTPSYRELPKDYQVTSCSGRSADEDAVLNDTWVSVPVGSEDSGSFKHMRRNPNEEQLFKVEDERFELDMLIDGVAAAIARLEPVEEEIEALRATAGSAPGQTLASAATRGEGDSTAVGPDSGDASAPQFQYRLDRRTLGALHVSTVSRLYGDHGPEVVDLLRKNPAVAIPVVLKRLRQKEEEWCVAREEAKNGWKELAQKHFHRSLDHRSYNFRREDKRHTSNRALLQEIKDRKVEEDPQKAAVVMAAREKVHNAQKDVLLLGRVSPTSTAADGDSLSGQGSTGEVDTAALDGSATAAATDSPGALAVKSDDTTAADSRPRSKEGMRALRQQAEQSFPWYMFAHLTLQYPTEGTAAIHEDIMELLTHTLARRPPSEDDVRQASTVVADLLPAFFTLVSSEQAANGDGGKEPSGSGGVQVVLSLPVLSSDDESDQDNSQSSGDERKGDRRGSPPRVADEGPDLTPDIQGSVPVKDSEGGLASTPLPQGQEVLFTTTDLYLVLRMHHLLAERLAEAKKLCREAGLSRQTVVASPKEVLRASAGIAGTGTNLVSGDKEEIGYKTFLGHLYDLLEEKINTERYEEGVRQLVGNQGYVLCGLDKLVVGLLQNLYRASADKVFHKLTQLYYYERTTKSEGAVPAIYRSHVQALLSRSDKEVVRVQYHPGAHTATGGWLVEPAMKMEFIGRMRTETRQEGAAESDSTTDGAAQNEATVAGDE